MNLQPFYLVEDLQVLPPGSCSCPTELETALMGYERREGQAHLCQETGGLSVELAEAWPVLPSSHKRRIKGHGV